MPEDKAELIDRILPKLKAGEDLSTAEIQVVERLAQMPGSSEGFHAIRYPRVEKT